MRHGGRVERCAVGEKRGGRNVVETIVGALVLVVAGVFVFYAFARSDRTGSDGYAINARFGLRLQAP